MAWLLYSDYCNQSYLPSVAVSLVMFSLRQVPRTHPMDRKSKKANPAIIFFLLLGTILSEANFQA